MKLKLATTGFAFLCTLQLGALWGVFSTTEALATTQPDGATVEPEQKPRFSLRCKGFQSDLGKSEQPTIDTADRLTEVGQWVGELEDNGLTLHSVDFEVGQKASNYPQAWVYVCMTPSADTPS
jgi:hypothetical protein